MTIFTEKHLILGAGGTGGHLFPAAAVARAFAANGYKITLLTDKRGLRFADDFKDYHVVCLPTANVRQGSLLKRFKACIILIKSIYQAYTYVQKQNPSAVIGFGGYPAFPASMAAVFNRKKLFLHEQNTILGRTNRVLRFFATKIFTSFKDTIGLEENTKQVFTGNPVRMQILDSLAMVPAPKTHLLSVLVTGGSQGAKIFTDIVPLAFSFLPKELVKNISVLHQARPELCDETKKLYEQTGLTCQVIPFIDNMGEALQNADLVITRSGASTLAEMATLGKAGIYVPLPTAADDQQTHNAKYFVKYGAGKLIPQDDLTPMLLAGMFAQYCKNPETLKIMGEKARKLGHPQAAQKIFDLIESCVIPVQMWLATR